MSAVVRGAAWLAVAAAYLGLWFLLTDTLNGPELLAGLATTALAVVATALVASEIHARPPAPSVSSLVRVPFEVTRDTGRLLLVLAGHVSRVRPARGVIRAEPFAAGGLDARGAGHRASATLRRSLTPNTVVIGFDRDAGAIVYHELYPTAGGRPRGRRP